MHDALVFERLGTPVAYVCTDRFLETARAIAEGTGFTGYPFAVIRHPIANLTPDECRQAGAAAAEQVYRLVVEG